MFYHETYGALQAFHYTVIKSALKQAGEDLGWTRRDNNGIALQGATA